MTRRVGRLAALGHALLVLLLVLVSAVSAQEIPWWFLVTDASNGLGDEPTVRGPYDTLRECEGMADVLFIASRYRLLPVRLGRDRVRCIPSATAPGRSPVAGSVTLSK